MISEYPLKNPAPVEAEAKDLGYPAFVPLLALASLGACVAAIYLLRGRCS